MDLGGVVSTAVLPGLAFGAELGAEVSWAGLPPVRLRVAAFPHREKAVGGDARLTFATGYAGLAVCPEIDRGRWHVLGVCLGADAGVLHARGEGTRPERTTSRVTYSGLGALRAALRVSGPWFVRGAAALQPPFSSDRYVVAGPGGSKELVFERSPLPWVIGLAAGLEVEP
jgi:hypothetical protein